MKKRLKEMEEEAAALREMQAKVEKEMGAVQGLIFYFLLTEFISSGILHVFVCMEICFWELVNEV